MSAVANLPRRDRSAPERLRLEIPQADDGFVGQDEVVSTLTTQLERGANVVIHGATGVGKTRLTNELLARARRTGRVTAYLRCNSASNAVPMGVFSPILAPNLRDRRDVGEVGEVREVSHHGGMISVQTLLHARSAVVALANERPPVLAVDDLHLIDTTSAAFLVELVDAGEIQLVATYLTGSFVPDPAGGLWHRGRAIRVALLSPTDADAVALAEQMAGAALADGTARRILELTRGNRLHLSVLMQSANDPGVFSKGPDGKLVLGAFQTAPGVVDFVRAKLAGLGNDLKTALEIIAMGEPMGIPEVESVTGLGAVAELEERGLVEVVANERRISVQITPPLFAEVIRAHASQLRKRALFRDLLNQAEKFNFRRKADLIRAAGWATQASISLPPEFGIAAARSAWFGQQPQVAGELARSLFDQDGTFEAGQIMSDVAFRAGLAETTERLTTALADSAGDGDQLVAATAGRALNRYWGLADLPGALDVLNQARPTLGSEEQLAELAATTATVLAFSGRAEEAIALAQPVLAGVFGRAKVHAVLSTNMALRYLGRADEAVAVVDAVKDLNLDRSEWLNMVAPMMLMAGRVAARRELGEFRSVEREALDLRTRGLETGHHDVATLAGLTAGVALSAQGRHREGLRYLDECVAKLRGPAHTGHRRLALALAAVVAGQAGLADHCRNLLAELDGVARHPSVLSIPHEWRARAWMARLESRPEDARTLMVRAADTAEALGDVPATVASLLDLARIGDVKAAWQRAEDLPFTGNGPFAATVVKHLRALAERDVSSLGEASVSYEALDAFELAGETAKAAAGQAARNGDQRLAARQSERSRRLAEHCDGGPVGSAPEIGAGTLSKREREVAELFATGLSTREIAERLYLSVRTVENHVARAYTKLNINTRNQLAEIFGVTV